MKQIQIFRAAIAVLCSISLFLPSGASVMGEVYFSPQTSLSGALDYSQIYAYDEQNDKHTRAYLLEYDPKSDDSLPLVTCGGSVYGRKTLDSMIGYKLRDPSRLAAAVNADFFSMKTGVPMGVVIEGGLVFSGPANENALVLTDSGHAYITTADIDIQMTTQRGGTLDIEYFNKYPTRYGAYLLTSFYGESTTSTLDSREIVLAADGGEAYITPNGSVSAVVREIRDSVSDSAIPAGCFVISYAKGGTAGDNAVLSSLRVGDRVSFESSSPLPNDIRLAVGGGDVILRNGVYDPALADEEHETLQNPRTAVGIRADGTLLFFACDGRRRGFSDGLTLEELASVMAEYGCVDALNLDGGGSTTVVIGQDGVPTTVNRPTEGGQRKIANAILFVNSEEYITRAALDVTPSTSAVLAGGSSLSLSAAYGGEIVDAERLTGQLDERAAGSYANGIFTSSNYIGQTTLTLRAEIDNKVVSGHASISVVDRITSLSLAEQSADDGVKLTLSAALYNAPVAISPAALAWSITDAVERDGALCASKYGWLDEELTFHPTYVLSEEELALDETAAKGVVVTITAAWGDVTAQLDITAQPTPPEDSDTPEVIEPPADPDTLEPPAITPLPEVTPPAPPSDIPAEPVFADIAEHWARDYISSAYALGYVNGVATEDGLYFYPQDKLTRAQLAVIVCGYLALDTAGGAVYTYTDISDIPQWALPYINAAVAAGVMRGRAVDGGGAITFDAMSNVSRAEAIAVLGGLIGSVSGSEDGDITIFTDSSDIPDWAAAMAARVVGAGVISGYEDGSLRPLSQVSRAEICTMLISAYEAANR